MKTKTQKAAPAVVLAPAAPVPAGGYTLGLDCGDRSHNVCVLAAAGQIRHAGPLLFITPEIRGIPFREALDKILRPQALTYDIHGNFIFLKQN